MKKHSMNIRLGSGLTIATLAASAGLAHTAFAGTLDWTGGDGIWTDAARWTPTGIPSWVDLARIGAHPSAQNSKVTYDSWGQLLAGLEITDGMILDTNNGYIGVIFHTLVSGLNDPPGPLIQPSQLWLRGGSGGPGVDFITKTLDVEAQARVRLLEDVKVEIGERLQVQPGSIVSGAGRIRLFGDAGSSYINDGILDPQGSMIVQQMGDAPIDLDGIVGNGEVRVGTELAIGGYDNLTITGTHLSDSFSSLLRLSTGGWLNMDLAQGWTADANSTIEISGGGAAQPARIQGGEFRIGGNFVMSPWNSWARIEADAEVLPTASLDIVANARVEFDGATHVSGGGFVLGEDALLQFDGDTVVSGGTFTTFSDSVNDGQVEFGGLTEFRGVVHFTGTASVPGEARVESPTTIHADTFAMTSLGSGSWDINNSLTINADRLGFGVSVVHGSISIGGGFLGRLTVDLPDDAAYWTMSGGMELIGTPSVFSTRIAGHGVSIAGDLLVRGGQSQITADTIFQSSSTTSFQSPTDALRLRGSTLVGAGAEFIGDGRLVNGIDGELLFFDGASIGQVALENSGVLELASGAGVAATGSFEQSTDGTWLVDVIGSAAGFTHDMLLVTAGTATLAGALEVDVSATSIAAYLPSVGDEFPILFALGGVSGAFSNAPISAYAGLTLEWSVLYHPNTVVLRLDNIVPGPGPAALLAIAAVGGLRRRRNSRAASLALNA